MNRKHIKQFLVWLWAAFVPAVLLFLLLWIAHATECTLPGIITHFLFPVILRYQGAPDAAMCVQYTRPNPLFFYFIAGSALLLYTLTRWIKTPSWRIWLATVLVGWVLCGPPGWIFTGVNVVNGPEPCEPSYTGYVSGYPPYPFLWRR